VTITARGDLDRGALLFAADGAAKLVYAAEDVAGVLAASLDGRAELIGMPGRARAGLGAGGPGRRPRDTGGARRAASGRVGFGHVRRRAAGPDGPGRGRHGRRHGGAAIPAARAVRGLTGGL
jgi:hypothetical protein